MEIIIIIIYVYCNKLLEYTVFILIYVKYNKIFVIFYTRKCNNAIKYNMKSIPQ